MEKLWYTSTVHELLVVKYGEDYAKTIVPNLPEEVAKLQIEEFLYCYERPSSRYSKPPMDCGPVRVEPATLAAIFNAASTFRRFWKDKETAEELKSVLWAYDGDVQKAALHLLRPLPLNYNRAH